MFPKRWRSEMRERRDRDLVSKRHRYIGRERERERERERTR